MSTRTYLVLGGVAAGLLGFWWSRRSSMMRPARARTPRESGVVIYDNTPIANRDSAF